MLIQVDFNGAKKKFTKSLVNFYTKLLSQKIDLQNLAFCNQNDELVLVPNQCKCECRSETIGD